MLQQCWLYAGQLAPVAELDADNRVVARFVYASKSNEPDYMVKGGASGVTNTAEFLIEGKAKDSDIIESRSALQLDGNKGGLPELIIDP